MSAPRVALFVPETPAGSNAILRARAFSMARILKEEGVEVFVVGAERNEESARRATSSIRQEFTLDAAISSNGRFDRGFKGVMITTLLARWQFASTLREFAPTAVYAQSSIGCLVARGIARSVGAQLILDVKGDLAAEVSMRRGTGTRARLAAWLEAHANRLADRHLTVSYRLADALARAGASRSAVVVPSSVDSRYFGFRPDARARLRAELGINHGEVLVCYSGGLSRWQLVPSIIELFERLAGRNSAVKFLFLTSNPARLAEMLHGRRQLENRAHIRSCGRDQVCDFLSAADAGILLREQHPVNFVASPIKVGEYLSCRLPVILTAGIGDTSEWVAQGNAGLVIDGPDSVEALNTFLSREDFESVRENAAKLFEERFELNRYRAALSELVRLSAN